MTFQNLRLTGGKLRRIPFNSVRRVSKSGAKQFGSTAMYTWPRFASSLLDPSNAHRLTFVAKLAPDEIPVKISTSVAKP